VDLELPDQQDLLDQLARLASPEILDRPEFRVMLDPPDQMDPQDLAECQAQVVHQDLRDKVAHKVKVEPQDCLELLER